MKTTNHEYYVSLEVAKLLKKAGFDWDTYSAYNKDGMFTDKNRSILTWNDFANYYSAPTLDVAQRWLREIKNIHIEISPNSDMSAYIYNILLPGDKFWLGSPISYITYEEAQEDGIKKALKKILEKGE